MKASKELIQHISTTFWDKSNKEIAQCLEDFKGNPLREEETPPEVKHPIERVNAKYPNGWYCEAFEEVREDSEKGNQEISQSVWEYYGWFSYEDLGFVFIGFNDVDDDDLDLSNVTLIPKSEYIAITRGAEEQPTTYAENPPIAPTVWDDINALAHRLAIVEDRLSRYEQGYELPTKRNLSIDTPTIDWKEIFERGNTVINCETEQEAVELFKEADKIKYVRYAGKQLTNASHWNMYKEDTLFSIKRDCYGTAYGFEGYTILRYRDIINPPKQDDWKKVECLSWEDVVKININCSGMSLGANLETFIKNKLKK